MSTRTDITDDRNEDQPGQSPSGKHLSGYPRPDNITDAEQSRINIHADQGIFKPIDVGLNLGSKPFKAVTHRLDDAADQKAVHDEEGAAAAAVAGFKHFRTGHPLRIRERGMFIDDQQPPQRYHHRHAKKAADEHNEAYGRHGRNMIPHIQCRQCKDGTCGNGLAGCGHRLNDVVLQNGLPSEYSP